jgi:hypothetical protein
VVRGSDVMEKSGWYRPEDLILLASRRIYASFIPVSWKRLSYVNLNCRLIMGDKNGVFPEDKIMF